ncbi:GTP-binding protein [Treponema sp. OttesenSCG-928-L16]|nr:GTP-binding protein [Treponema sp. OttesenSCG-928-L16]
MSIKTEEQIQEKPQMFFITGFSGAGKTAVLNDVLSSIDKRESAVRVHKWNHLNIERTPFYSNIPFSENRYIFVETMGLARPVHIHQLVNSVQKHTENGIKYKGMICIIDAVHFLEMYQEIMSVYEQACYAACFIISKKDMVDEAKLDATRKVLKAINPFAPVFFRDSRNLSFHDIRSRMDAAAMIERGEIKPRSTTLIPEAPIQQENLESFLQEILPKTFKIKGFLHIKGKPYWLNVESLGNSLSLTLLPEEECRGTCLGLTFIWKTPSIPDSELIREWNSFIGVKGYLIA